MMLRITSVESGRGPPDALVAEMKRGMTLHVQFLSRNVFLSSLFQASVIIVGDFGEYATVFIAQQLWQLRGQFL